MAFNEGGIYRCSSADNPRNGAIERIARLFGKGSSGYGREPTSIGSDHRSEAQSKSFAKLDAFDQWLADAYFATLAASSVVWTTASGSGVIAYAGSGPDGSHHYTDWGKVITADATAAVGELAAWGLSAAAGLAAPPVGVTAAAILAIAAAIASFLYWLSGDATVIIERDPGPGTPGGGGEERPPVV